MRKAQDDAMARTAAERFIGDVMESDGIIDSTVYEPTEAGRRVLGAFKAAGWDTTTRKVGDQEIKLRRLVLTGPWEVDPSL